MSGTSGSMRPATTRNVIALASLGALPWMTLVCLPFFIRVYVEDWGYSETIAGLLTTSEIVGLTAGCFFTSFLVRSKDARHLCVGGVIIVLVGNGLSSIASDVPAMALARALAGAGLGALAATVNALPARLQVPQQLYTYMQFGLCTFAVTVTYGASSAMHWFPQIGLFVAQAAFAAVLGLSIAWLPRPKPEREAVVGRPRVKTADSTVVYQVLASTALMFATQTAIWSFAERVGGTLGFSTSQLASLFALSAATAFIGAAGAWALKLSCGLFIPIALGYVLQLAIAFALYATFDKGLFIAGILSLNAAAVFVTPYLMGTLARLDASGRAGALGTFATNFGSALGPTAAAFCVTSSAGYAGLGVISAAMLIIGLLFIAPVARRAATGAGEHAM